MPKTKASIIRCDRCHRRLRGNLVSPSNEWNCTLKRGRIVGYTCPDCQTSTENAEAIINEATLVYGRDSQGRHIAWPRYYTTEGA